MKRSIHKGITIIVLIGLLVGAAVLAVPAVAQAQSTNPPAATATPAAQSAQDRQANQAARLEKAYQAELKQSDVQAKRLSAADARVQKFTDRIAALKALGKDTTALDAALSNFKTMLATAHTDHESAANILKTHAGFDASGKVTNAQLAQDTVQQARQLLRDVPQTLRPSIRDIVQAIRQFIKANRR